MLEELARLVEQRPSFLLTPGGDEPASVVVEDGREPVAVVQVAGIRERDAERLGGSRFVPDGGGCIRAEQVEL